MTGANAEDQVECGALIPTDIIARFAVADPALIRQRTLRRRNDTKFLVPASHLSELIEPLVDDYALMLAGDRPFAAYRTLYFDTPDYTCYHAHASGRHPCYKVRVRHYDDRELSYLEVKMRCGDALTFKNRRRRAYGDHDLREADREFVVTHSSVPGPALRPVAWTNFHRLTLISLADNERVTIDMGVEFRHQERVQRLQGVAIVEVKQASYSAYTPVMRVLRDAGRQPALLSKYCNAMAFAQNHSEGTILALSSDATSRHIRQ